MDWLELLQTVCEVCVIPLLGVLTTFAIKYLRAKEKQVLDKIESDTGDKYASMVADTIADCVAATTQTYVQALKDRDLFDGEAQKHALEMTKNAVLDILNDDAKDYLVNVYGDLNAYLTTKIEAEIKFQK